MNKVFLFYTICPHSDHHRGLKHSSKIQGFSEKKLLHSHTKGKSKLKAYSRLNLQLLLYITGHIILLISIEKKM